MSLIDETNGAVIQLERTSSLEGEGRKTDGEVNAADMASYIEVPTLAQGSYRLEIAVQKALFLPTREYPTCLTFDLVVEYVARPKLGSAEKSKYPYEILSVWPLALT